MQPDEKFPLLPEFGRLRDEESFKSDFLHLVSFSFIDSDMNFVLGDIGALEKSTDMSSSKSKVSSGVICAPRWGGLLIGFNRSTFFF
jgi:hypothetical protein